MRQGMLSLSAPTKALEMYIVSGALRHNAHPVLRWNVSNAAVELDAAGNCKLSKRASTERIDGAVALVMAVDRMERNTGEPAGPFAEWSDADATI
jgi:phage terminase large subunit-like protein